MRFLFIVIFANCILEGYTQNLKFRLQDFYSDNKQLDSTVNFYFSQLNDTQRVGQMICQATGAIGKPKQEITSMIKQGYLGGVLYLKVEKEECRQMCIDFNKTASETKTLPLLFSTDGEPSLINFKIKGLEPFKKTNSIQDTSESAAIGTKISKILSNLGIRQNYAPVCDLAINKEVINNRSYHSEESVVIPMARSFIRASQNKQVAATAKHFPGHGNVKGDTHKNLVFIDGDMIELNIYKKLIADSVISVMVGHIAVKNNEKYNTNGLPSTCSRKIVTDLLRGELGFKGIIVTDGMNMGALNAIPDATLKAIEAGCDIIIIPPSEKKLALQVIKKMNTDPAFLDQVYTSVKRVIRLKVCLGLM
jgi:beta-N-acetylhexosaminidase